LKIISLKMFHVDAGWRPWTFIKIATDSGLIGWSECTDSHGSPSGMEGVLKDLSPLLLGNDPREIRKLIWILNSRTRQSHGSIIQKTIGGIENALWDILAKEKSVPVYKLLGGSHRDSIPAYWSHCGTTRVRAWDIVKQPQIKKYADIREFSKEVISSGFKAVKTNIAILDGNPYVYMPGFYKSKGGPSLNADNNLLSHVDLWIGNLRDSLGDEIDIALDLNFNFRTEGYIKLGKLIEKYNLMWLEIDSLDPSALRVIKDNINTPITSCENLYGISQYRPFFEKYAMDIVSIDVIWNGLMESLRIAEFANSYEMNICPHNYNGHLSTFISMQFCALTPNLRMAEVDVDEVPWRDELFTNIPQFENGALNLPTCPGWGTDLNEDALLKYQWKR